MGVVDFLAVETESCSPELHMRPVTSVPGGPPKGGHYAEGPAEAGHYAIVLRRGKDCDAIAGERADPERLAHLDRDCPCAESGARGPA